MKHLEKNYAVIVRETDRNVLKGVVMNEECDLVREARVLARTGLDYLGDKPTMTMNNGWTVDSFPAGAVLTHTVRHGRMVLAKSADGSRVLEVINLNVDRSRELFKQGK